MECSHNNVSLGSRANPLCPRSSVVREFAYSTVKRYVTSISTSVDVTAARKTAAQTRARDGRPLVVSLPISDRMVSSFLQHS